MEHFIVFTDGASRGNPGPGGYGVVVVSLISKQVWEFGGREDSTTNNRMEMAAIVKALEEIGKMQAGNGADITIHTDSKYVMQGATSWIFGWQKNNWQTKQKTDVLNRDLWEKIFDLMKNKKIEWKYVPGHAGVPGNERVDEIGTKLADKESIDLYHGALDQYFVKDVLNTDYDEKEVKEKKSGKAYSYVSLVDGVVKTHTDWNSCKLRTEGKKAKFKKVFSEEEEKALIDEWSSK